MLIRRRGLVTGAAAVAAYGRISEAEAYWQSRLQIAIAATGPALVITTAIAGSNTGGTSPAVNTTGATLLVLVTTSFLAPSTPTDSKSNTWVAGPVASISNLFSKIFYVLSPTVGSGHTFSNTSAASSSFILSFSGISALDQTNQNTAASPATTVQPGSITPSVNNTVIIAAMASDAATTFSVNSSFTLPAGLKSAFSSGTTEGGAASYLLQGTAGAVNPTFTLSPGSNLSATIASFKP